MSYKRALPAGPAPEKEIHGCEQHRVDEFRKTSEIENNLIDALTAGKIAGSSCARDRPGPVLSALSFIAAPAAGTTTTTAATGTTEGTAKPGGALRTGIIAPAIELNPLVVYDEGGLAVLGQSGEYLAWSNDQLELEPRLAELDAERRRLDLDVQDPPGRHVPRRHAAHRQGRRLHPQPQRGPEERRERAPRSETRAASRREARRLDDATVVVTLNGPNGSFPYLVSSDNYNVIILPDGFDPATWESRSWEPSLGSRQVHAAAGVTYTKNPNYWDTQRQPLADTSELRFYAEDQARILAIQGGEVDVLSQFQIVAGGEALLNDPNITVTEVKAAQHRQIHMRTDQEPFQDKRVRQAMALLLDRPTIIEGFFQGKADIGNDSPFAPVYPYTDTTVPQREVNGASSSSPTRARATASRSSSTWDNYEIPQLAQLLQGAAKEVGITITLNITDAGTYYRTSGPTRRSGSPTTATAESRPSSHGRAREQGHLERRSLQGQDTRRLHRRLRVRARCRRAKAAAKTRGVPPRGDSRHLPVFLRPSVRRAEQRHGIDPTGMGTST